MEGASPGAQDGSCSQRLCNVRIEARPRQAGLLHSDWHAFVSTPSPPLSSVAHQLSYTSSRPLTPRFTHSHTHTHTHTCTHTHTHAHTRTHSPISSLQMQSLQTELAQKTRAVRTRTPLLSQPRLNLLSCSWLSCLYQCPNVLLQPMSSSTSLLAQTSCTSTHCPAHARTHTHTLSPFVLPTHMRALRCAA